MHLAVAAAGGCHGQVLDLQAPVLYLAPEDSDTRMYYRLEQLAPARNLALSFAFDWPALDNGGLDELAGEIECSPLRYRLVIVDTFTSALSIDTRFDCKRMVRVLQQLFVLSTANDLAILLVDRHRFPDTIGSADAVDMAFADANCRRMFDRTMTLNRPFGQVHALLTLSDSARPLTLPSLPDLRSLPFRSMPFPQIHGVR
jgi:hypothetical protein